MDDNSSSQYRWGNTMSMAAASASASSLWSTYISFTTSVLLIRTTLDNFFPHPVRRFLHRQICRLFPSTPSTLTLTIEESDSDLTANQLYSAAETYLFSKLSPDIQRLKVIKAAREDNLTLHFDNDEDKIVDIFQGIEIKWRFERRRPKGEGSRGGDKGEGRERKRFELSFEKKHRETVLGSYLPYIQEQSEAIEDSAKVMRLYTNIKDYNPKWSSVVLRHPSTFETLAMDATQKKVILDDLDRFVRRKEFYRKVGRAWKRGYLLYGPPGTGKSSLIAAMANHLRFSIYDVQLTNITKDADLKKLLVQTSNKSILVFEDIDCSVDLRDRKENHDSLGQKEKINDSQITLSGLLNFIDGLWSCCGDERIIIFTTNHKDKIDPALLRPGRMDMHILMSYCTPQAFQTLASNYLGVSSSSSGDHHHHPLLFPEIQAMLQSIDATPAELAEELMKSEDPDMALAAVAHFLKRKRAASLNAQEEQVDTREAKRQKVGEQLIN